MHLLTENSEQKNIPLNYIVITCLKYFYYENLSRQKFLRRLQLKYREYI